MKARENDPSSCYIKINSGAYLTLINFSDFGVTINIKSPLKNGIPS